MTTIFALAATLLIFLALWILVPPLLRARRADPKRLLNVTLDELESLGEQKARGSLGATDYEAARNRLGADFIQQLDPDAAPTVSPRARWIAGFVALTVPILAVAVYLQIGTPVLINQPASGQVTAGHDAADMPSIQAMIASLEKKLESEPDNIEGWYTLARSYMSLEQYDQAAAAMGKVYAQVKDNANILVQYADALTMASDGRVEALALQVVNEAIALEPAHPEALWLAGIAADQRGEYTQAIQYWQRAQAPLSGNPESSTMLEQAIAQVRAKLGDSATATPDAARADTSVAAAATVGATTPATPAAKAAGSGASVSIAIKVADELLPKVGPDDTVFVFARDAAGPPMPIAARRYKVSELPVEITLDDAASMTPERKLSQFPRVIVVARISKGGNPVPQPGDLEGLSAPIAPLERSEIAITIDRMI
ncbi:MAG: c-type cytochrome biogenesis protein CcmI [Thiotrichales bacterium]